MSYGQWVIKKEETIKNFGYDPSTLTKGSKKPVICICESCGVVSNKKFRESNRKHVCQTIIDGKKKCFKCKTKKNVDEFSKNRSTLDGYSKVCKECFSNYQCVIDGYKKKSNKIKTDLKTYLNHKIGYLKNKAKKKNLPFNLDKDFLYKIYLKQEGKCYYSGMKIEHNVGCYQHNSISVDRLDPNKGYTVDNVVLSSFIMNSFKSDMTELEFKKFLNDFIPKLIMYAKN